MVTWKLILLTTVVPMVVAPFAAFARSNPVLTCQRNVEKLGEALVQKIMRAEHACLAKQSIGKLSAATVCTGQGPSLGDITDSRTHATVETAISKTRAAVQAKCQGVDLRAVPPDGLGFPVDCQTVNGACDLAVQSLDSALDCFMCAHVGAAHYLLGVERPATVFGYAFTTPTPASTPATHATPFLVKDISPGPNSGCCDEKMVSVGGLVFFGAAGGVWRSDGTPTGTIPLQSNGYHATDLTVVGDYVFFADFTQPGGGFQLWRTDGSPEGTIAVADMQRCANDSPDTLTNVNGTLFFEECDAIWKSDGTPDGTVLVSDDYFQLQPFFTSVGDTMFFVAQGDIFKTDGTVTTLVHGIAPGNQGGAYAPFTVVGETLFFSADDGLTGRELWKSDGTPEGTALVHDIASGFAVGSIPAFFNDMVAQNGAVIFVADDGTTGSELWRSDGTAAGTRRIKDINSGATGSYPFNMRTIDGVVFFSANNERGNEPWRTDGTPNGTVRIADVRPGPDGSGAAEFTGINGIVFFTADDGVHGSELWRTDGTQHGTFLVADIRPGDAPSFPHFLIGAGATLFFSAIGGQETNFELWAVKP